MHFILSYIIKCTLASGILAGYYYVALRNKKFNAYNRVYLLAAIVVSLMVPFMRIEWFTIMPPQNSTLNTVVAVIANPQHQAAGGFNAGAVCLVCAIVISMALLIILSAKIVWIYRVKKSSNAIKMNGYNLIETDAKQAPFSFLDNLFWRNGIALTDEGWQKVLRHELVHIKQRHTYDKLFAQITVCIFWMNPFFWLMQRELAMIHEFIADEGSIKDGDTKAFALMLLQAHNQGRYLNPQHSFFHSPIKRRLIMITTSKHTPYSYMRRVLAIPIAAMVVTLFSVTVSRAQTETEKKSPPQKIKIISKEEKAAAKTPGDTITLVKIAYKPVNSKNDTLQVKDIHIIPGKPITGEDPKTINDSGRTIIFITKPDDSRDTINSKNLESIQVTGKPLKLSFVTKPGGVKDSSNRVNVIDLTPIEVVGKPSKKPAKQQ